MPQRKWNKSLPLNNMRKNVTQTLLQEEVKRFEKRCSTHTQVRHDTPHITWCWTGLLKRNSFSRARVLTHNARTGNYVLSHHYRKYRHLRKPRLCLRCQRMMYFLIPKWLAKYLLMQMTLSLDVHTLAWKKVLFQQKRIKSIAWETHRHYLTGRLVTTETREELIPFDESL